MHNLARTRLSRSSGVRRVLPNCMGSAPESIYLTEATWGTMDGDGGELGALLVLSLLLSLILLSSLTARRISSSKVSGSSNTINSSLILLFKV